MTGKGNYSGSVSKTFKITARAINDVEVTVPDTVFTGEQVRPDVVVSYGNYQFINNSDYTLSFKDNVNIGTASVVVTGKKHLSGSRTVTFPIEKAEISRGSRKLLIPVVLRYIPSPARNLMKKPVIICGVSGQDCRKPVTLPFLTGLGTAV